MRPIDSPRPILSDTSLSAQNSSICSRWLRLNRPRKCTFSEPDGLCRRKKRFETSRASTIGKLWAGALDPASYDQASGSFSESIFEPKEQRCADGEGDYGVRDRERPNGRLRPAPVEEQVLVGDDV